MKKALIYKVVLGCFIILLAFLLVFPVRASGQILYDNFSSNSINVEKWQGDETWGSGIRNAEVIRQINAGGLHMFLQTYGSSGIGSNDLLFTDPGAITSIKFSIKVNKAKILGCSNDGSATAAIAAAGIAGTFFNTSDTPPTSGSKLNDVMVLVSVGNVLNSPSLPPLPKGSQYILGVVFHCLDQFCSNYEMISGVDLGFVKVGEKVNLTVEWDKANHKFIFQRGKKPPIDAPYSVSDIYAPGGPFKKLYIYSNFLLCTDGGRPKASVDAYFDNVYVN